MTHGGCRLAIIIIIAEIEWMARVKWTAQITHRQRCYDKALAYRRYGSMKLFFSRNGGWLLSNKVI
jgi:hypothetical protein